MRDVREEKCGAYRMIPNQQELTVTGLLQTGQGLERYGTLLLLVSDWLKLTLPQSDWLFFRIGLQVNGLSDQHDIRIECRSGINECFLLLTFLDNLWSSYRWTTSGFTRGAFNRTRRLCFTLN